MYIFRTYCVVPTNSHMFVWSNTNKKATVI